MGAHSASTPQCLHVGALAVRGCPLPLLVSVEESSQRVDGYGVAAQVGQPDHESEPTWDAALAQRGGDEEEELEEEARQDEDPQLPLLPPLHRA